MGSINVPQATLQSNATGAHLTITVEELMNLRLVALGKRSPSLIVRRGLVLTLHTGELLPRDVVISGRHIAAITPWDHFPTIDNEIDATNRFVSPGFIDTHIHIEYTKLVPGELARLSVPRGTTTLLADANCIANVLGPKGMDYMATTSTPLRIFQQVSHKVPSGSPGIELGGITIPTETLCERVSTSYAATLGESNPFSLDLASAQKQAAALHAGKRITGHTALLKNEPLWAYAAGGISDDHNAHQPEDVLERLRLGLMLTVMSGSMNSNIEPVLKGVELYKHGLNHMSFCADDKFVEDLDREGHIDHHVREAIELGVEPVQAYRIATLNAAMYYRIDHLVGSVTPAKLADLLILGSLEDARPEIIVVNGQVVARDGTALFKNEDPIPSFALNTVHLDPTFFAAETYHTYRRSSSGASSAYVQAVEMYDGYFKRAFHTKLSLDPDEKFLVPNIELDVLKVVVIDRHHKTRNHGTSFVRGFKLRKGAIACTTNCENQNLVIAGTSDSDIAFAAKAIHALGGGYVAVADGEVLGAVELAVAGCMSKKPWEEVAEESRKLDRIVHHELVGADDTPMQVPFMILSFVGLVGVPDLGLTEMGLVITSEQKLMDVVLDEEDVASEIETVQGEARATRICCRCPSHKHDIHRLLDAAG
ncbi:hypothetical protein LTR85_003329 [Meristemomyces frigidus]|nr:hypothetical protein LTR85_003329 [Meristemomyces frigidus]